MRKPKNKRAGIILSKKRKAPIRAAADYGIDIPMLMANLARTPAERIRRHQIAFDTYEMLRKSNCVGPLDEMKERGDGKLVRVFTVDSLIKARKAMNRPRDRQAILELEAIRKTQTKHRKI